MYTRKSQAIRYLVMHARYHVSRVLNALLMTEVLATKNGFFEHVTKLVLTMLSFVKTIVYCLILLFAFAASAQHKTNSVLRIGNWYRVGITKTGLYKIDAAFLSANGIEKPSNIANIRVFGNGQSMLPQRVGAPRIDDLAEIPIFIQNADSDSTFSGSDQIVFYARGPHSWNYNTESKLFEHTYNIYSDTAYYFINISEARSKQVRQDIQSLNANAITLWAYPEYDFYEKDLFNLIASGQIWLGERIDNSSLRVSMPIKNPIADSVITGRVMMGVKPSKSSTTTFTVDYNGVAINSLPFTGFDACQYCSVAYRQEIFSNLHSSIPKNNQLTLNITYNKADDAGAEGYLDFVEINYWAATTYVNTPLYFRSHPLINAPVQFNLNNLPSNSVVFNVTNIHDPFIVSRSAIVSQPALNSVQEYVAFANDVSIPSPSYVGRVSNQDLHSTPPVTLLIITHPSMLEVAKEYAKNRTERGISNVLATTQQIYNEFSSGMQDVTAIRDFAKMLFDKGQLKNMVLLGACSYDYKNRINSNTNMVPVYESRESFHTINSYSSDDFYTFFNNSDGDWFENPNGNHLMQIGIGRVPVRNATELSDYLTKLKQYESKITFGKWRNRLLFMSDNGDANTHLKDAERMTNFIDQTWQTFNLDKLYIDAFKLVSTPSGNRVPELNDAFRENLFQGCAIVNYSGHGGPEQLAQENILDIETIKRMRNKLLPFFVTATCDFGVYDDPAKLSGGVSVVLNPNGGGIGIITSGRPVFQYTNYLLNQAFYQSVFERDSNQQYLTVGEVFKKTKNRSLLGINNRSYTLLSDPSLTLSLPAERVQITSINGISVSQFKDTIKALSLVKIEGIVSKALDSSLISSFNGTMYIDVYDKPASVSTFGNSGSIPTAFNLRNVILHLGTATVKNGRFTCTFKVPKDINYSYGNGKLSFYAFSDDLNTDATGAYTNFIFGGANPLAQNDTIAPQIQLFVDDTTFKSGGYAANPPTLLAKLFDENGINLSSAAVGHELTASLTANPDVVYKLNSYYLSDPDTYKSGRVSYMFNELPDGRYTLQFKAWDTYNNSAEKSIDFIIAQTGKMAIQKVFNFPNPFRDQTTFSITHNRSGDDIYAQVEIFNTEGVLVHTLYQTFINAEGTLFLPFFSNNGTDYNLSPGLYVFKCSVTSNQLGSKTEVLQKLVLIR